MLHGWRKARQVLCRLLNGLLDIVNGGQPRRREGVQGGIIRYKRVAVPIARWFGTQEVYIGTHVDKAGLNALLHRGAHHRAILLLSLYGVLCAATVVGGLNSFPLSFFSLRGNRSVYCNKPLVNR